MGRLKPFTVTARNIRPIVRTDEYTNQKKIYNHPLDIEKEGKFDLKKVIHLCMGNKRHYRKKQTYCGYFWEFLKE